MFTRVLHSPLSQVLKDWDPLSGIKLNLQNQQFADVLKNFAIFTGEHLYRSLFLIKLQKRDCDTGVFLFYFQEQLFYRTPLVAASESRECFFQTLTKSNSDVDFYPRVFRSWYPVYTDRKVVLGIFWKLS